MLRTTLGATLAVALLSGCVSVQNKPLAAGASTQLEGKTLAYAVHPKPDFSAVTGGTALLGVFGAIAEISKGNKIVAENNVPDPAVAIGSDLTRRLSDRLHMAAQSQPVQVVSDNMGVLAAQASTADYLLDVQTINWMYNYYPSKPTHYEVFYSARLRLIDVHSKAVVAEAGCKMHPNTEANAPTQNELLKDHASGLKHWLDKAATDCANQAATNLLHV